MYELLPKGSSVALVVVAGNLVASPGLCSTSNVLQSPNAGQPITTTLLPEIADRMLREHRVASLPFAKLTSVKNHPGENDDCVSCHRHDQTTKGRLPRNHAKAKDHEAWSAESWERCHMREGALSNLQTAATAIAIADNGYCIACHGNANLKMVFPDATESTSLFVDRDHFARSVHGELKLPCVGCHRVGNFPHQKIAFRTSRALARSIERESCRVCHPEQTDQFRKSVHGGAHLDGGGADIPGCTDCHGFHSIPKIKDTAFRMGMAEICGRCHSNSTIAAKYGMSPEVATNYSREFHGAAIRLARNQGPTVASNKPLCHDCHGAHDITKVSDPNSRLTKDRLVAVCRKCHQKAGTKFVGAWMGHASPTLRETPIVYLTQISYKLLTVVVMGQFGLYMLLEVLRSRINRYGNGRRP